MNEGPSREKPRWGGERPEARSAPKGPREKFEETVDAIFAQAKDRHINVGSELEAMLVYASYFLNHPYPEFFEQFRLEPNGSLTQLTERDVSIADWAATSAPKEGHTTEDLRQAAARFNARFPQIRFDFVEDRTKGTFSYTATLPSD